MPAPKGHAPYNKNGEGGRPRKWDGLKVEELADSLDKWIENAIEFKKEFWWWDWCFDVGLNQEKVSIIAKRNDRFRQSYENAKQWQESIIVKGSLGKKLSEGMSKFVLINRHGDRWKEKSESVQNLAPNDALIDSENRSMLLQARLEATEAKLNLLLEKQVKIDSDNISKAE